MNQVATTDVPISIDPSDGRWHRMDGPALASSDACRLALTAYERTFRMCSIVEPDVGFAERFAAGTRSLEARCQADPWILTPDRTAALERLLAEVERVACDDVGDWLDRFPRAFLGILERRTGPGVLPDADGRRFAERLRVPQPLVTGMCRPG